MGFIINTIVLQYRMKTLLFAGILYLTGVVVILLLRPSLMFDEKGQWKEFGTISNEHTIFPFWLFCIFWGAFSYCLTLFFISEPAGAVGAVVTAVAANSELPDGLVHPLPPKKKSKSIAKTAINHGDMKPGYYILDTKEMKKTGIPKYTYVGPEVGGATESESEE